MAVANDALAAIFGLQISLESDNFSAVLYRAWLFATASRWGRIRMKFVVKMRASCL
jgi:hypothetical protein